MTQPKPKKNSSKPIVDLVIEEFLQRKDMGLKTYGTPLQKWNGRDSLQDLLDELMDAVLYLRQHIEEQKDVKKRKKK